MQMQFCITLCIGYMNISFLSKVIPADKIKCDLICLSQTYCYPTFSKIKKNIHKTNGHKSSFEFQISGINRLYFYLNMLLKLNPQYLQEKKCHGQSLKFKVLILYFG